MERGTCMTCRKKVRACGRHHHVFFLFLFFLPSIQRVITSCQTWSNLTIARYNQRPFGKFLATNYCMAIVVGLHWQLQSRQLKSSMLNKGITKMQRCCTSTYGVNTLWTSKESIPIYTHFHQRNQPVLSNKVKHSKSWIQCNSVPGPTN